MSLRWASRKQSIALLRNMPQRCGIGKCAARVTEWCCHLGGMWVLMAGFGMPLMHAMSCALGCFVSIDFIWNMNAARRRDE